MKATDSNAGKQRYLTSSVRNQVSDAKKSENKMFLRLLPEIRDIVLLFLRGICDLKNLSLVSKEYRDVLRHHVAHTVRIDEQMLERKDFLTGRRLQDMLTRLQYTKVLRVSVYRHCLPVIFYRTLSRLSNLEELDMCRSTNVVDYDVNALCEVIPASFIKHIQSQFSQYSVDLQQNYSKTWLFEEFVLLPDKAKKQHMKSVHPEVDFQSGKSF